MDKTRCSSTAPAQSGNPAVARMPLTDIALRIQQHLHRFAADPATANRAWVDGNGVARTSAHYWNPLAYRGGSRVMVRYVAYQYTASLTRDDALKYLAWLDAGNVGPHYGVGKLMPQPGCVELGETLNTESSPNNNVAATPAGKGETE